MALITVENARELALRGNAIRWSRFKAEQDKPLIAEAVPQPDYPKTILARVRKQIDLVLTLMDKSKDPLEVEKLCRSLAALCETERELDGRPKQGSRKPAPERSTKRRDLGSIEPSQPAPAPQPVAYNPSSPDAPNG